MLTETLAKVNQAIKSSNQKWIIESCNSDEETTLYHLALLPELKVKCKFSNTDEGFSEVGTQNLKLALVKKVIPNMSNLKIELL